MRGGAAAAAGQSSYSSSGTQSRYTAPYQARAEACFTPVDSHLIQFGIPNENFLSATEYNAETAYSDHAPIIYNFKDAPAPITNRFISIITWNVGQCGNYYDKASSSYNHKFNMERVEYDDEYRTRLENLVMAMAEMLLELTHGNPNPYYPIKGGNYPFLFCQELPTIEPFRKEFIDLLTKNGLGLLCDGDRANPNEFALIVKQGMQSSQRFIVLDKSIYDAYTYTNGSLVFPNSSPSSKYPHGLPNQELRRFEIYYYAFGKNTYYYVNIHAKYTVEPTVIVNFLNRIVDIIQIYHTSQQSQQPNINGVTIYLIGDYNFNIASPAINDLIDDKYSKNPFLELPRKINSMYKLTTRNAEGFSLIDNAGTISPCNIDCILKLDLASG